jgi:hypothetical protein
VIVNLTTLFKAVDALMTFRDAAKRYKASSSATLSPVEAVPAPAVQGLAGQVEARLTNVVVAALKEAFDRDHARLELERAHIEEERRRADEALLMELRRQAADRELGRLRLLAGIAMVGWIASVAMLATRLASASTPARVVMAVGWMLLLGSLAAAFTAQRRVGAYVPDRDRGPDAGPAATASLWLLIAGLAMTAVSLLL